MENKTENNNAVPIVLHKIKSVAGLQLLSEANDMTLLVNNIGQVFRVNPDSQTLEELGN